MKPKKGLEYEFTIDRLVYGGRGIGRLQAYEGLENFKVFVEGVAPGDKVKGRISKVRSGYAEAKLMELLELSPRRIPARCKHFAMCGGCKWQFLSYEDQCKVKEQQVRDAAQRIGGMDPAVVNTILPCAEPWFYRNKMELSFGEGPNGEVMLGLYPLGYHYEVFDLEECFLESEDLTRIAKKVRDFANEHQIPVYNSRTHEGLLRTLTVREGKHTGERMVILTTSTGVFDHREAFVGLFKDEPVSSLYWNSIYQVPGQPTWTEENLLAGQPALTEALILENGRRLEFDVLPQAFFQTNTRQAELLYSKVVEAAGLSEGDIVFDLYCGTGTIGLFCAHKAKQVLGIEVNEAAVESARGNAKRNDIGNVRFLQGGVEQRLSGLNEKPDVVIVDPPRAGLEGETVDQVAAFGAKRVVYVSCNPTTLARDLKRFSELGYTTQSITPVDMFPQTHHVESIALLAQNETT